MLFSLSCCNEVVLQLQIHTHKYIWRADHLNLRCSEVLQAPTELEHPSMWYLLLDWILFHISNSKHELRVLSIICMSYLVSWRLKLVSFWPFCDVIWPWCASQIAKKVASWLFHRHIKNSRWKRDSLMLEFFFHVLQK